MTRRFTRSALAFTALATAVLAASGCGDAFVPAPGTVPTIVRFSANPDRIASGASSLLSWRVEDADSVVITPSVGRVAMPDTGDAQVTPPATTTYVLTAYGVGGTRTANVTLLVGTPVPTCGSNALTLQSFTCVPAAFSNDQPRQIEFHGTGFRAGMIVTLGATQLAPVTVIGDSLALVTVPAAWAPGVYAAGVQFSPLGPSIPVGHAVIVTRAITNGTALATRITANTTLTPSGNPYRLVGATTVDAGATLTIEPGVVILASSGASLLVTNGARLVAGEGADPVVITSADGRTGSKWNAIELRSGTGPHVLQNVVVELGGQGTSGAMLRVLSSNASLCDVIVRESASNGLACALEANGTLAQAANLYLADNAAAGLFLDGGARATAGAVTGVVRNNALGVTRTGFLSSDCPRWDLAGLSFRANPGGDVGPCP